MILRLSNIKVSVELFSWKITRLFPFLLRKYFVTCKVHIEEKCIHRKIENIDEGLTERF